MDSVRKQKDAVTFQRYGQNKKHSGAIKSERKNIHVQNIFLTRHGGPFFDYLGSVRKGFLWLPGPKARRVMKTNFEYAVCSLQIIVILWLVVWSALFYIL